jgi:hypothetical protein
MRQTGESRTNAAPTGERRRRTGLEPRWLARLALRLADEMAITSCERCSSWRLPPISAREAWRGAGA